MFEPENDFMESQHMTHHKLISVTAIKADLIKAKFFIAAGRGKKRSYTFRYPTVLFLDNYFFLGGSGIKLGSMSKLVKMKILQAK